MARITWDVAGTRLFEDGLDRGVLYLTDGSGVAWNGLVSVTEEPGSGAATPLFFDGKKYFDQPNGVDFSGTITAWTYPNQFLQFDGYALTLNGMYFNNQNRSTFSLSYRTYIGNDLSDVSYGYKIHILYDLTADPSNLAYETLNDSSEPSQFSWKVNSRPVAVSGYFPVSHVVIDAKTMTSTALTNIENVLYGTVSTAPRIPTPTELLTLAV